MCEVICWKSRQKRETVQNGLDNVGITPFRQAILCKRMVRSEIFGSQIDSSSYLETASSESAEFELSKVYPNK